MPFYADPGTVAAVAVGRPPSFSSTSSQSALANCQREVLTLRSALEEAHAREMHLYEQLCQRDACCREEWPSLLLQYASTQRHLLLQQHQDHLRHVDELLFTFQTQQTRREHSHQYEMAVVKEHMTESRQRLRVQAEADAVHVELGIAQAAVETRRRAQLLESALAVQEERQRVVLAERDAALTRVAELEHLNRTLAAAHEKEMRQNRAKAEVERREQWIAAEAMRRAYDALFTSWTATQAVCDILQAQPRQAAAGLLTTSSQHVASDQLAFIGPRASAGAASLDLESVLQAAEAHVRRVIMAGPPPPLMLCDDPSLPSERDPAEDVDACVPTAYDHVRLCAQQHALLQRCLRVVQEVQALQDDWKSRLARVEKQSWSASVARKILGQDFAACLDRMVHAVEKSHPDVSVPRTALMPFASTDSLAVPPRPSAGWVPERTRSPARRGRAPEGTRGHRGRSKAEHRAWHQSSVLPDQVKPRFAF